MASPFSWPVLVPSALRAPAPVNLGVRPSKMPQEAITQLFIQSGWKGSSLDCPALLTEQPRSTAERIIAEFGSLQVGSVGAGRDLPASDVHFYSRLRPEVSVVAEPWLEVTGILWGIATAHHEHMIILAGAQGKIYAFTDPDEQLYLLGLTFSEAMKHLLLGYSYGEPIAKGL